MALLIPAYSLFYTMLGDTTQYNRLTHPVANDAPLPTTPQIP